MEDSMAPYGFGKIVAVAQKWSLHEALQKKSLRYPLYSFVDTIEASYMILNVLLRLSDFLIKETRLYE
ncbi:MAG: hypothetical protein FWG98_05130 [Candidatus Cloacimonetes bacterium]|nr:hypothetical protein [Candidatus Cloacimonadota bacterium]